MPISPRKRMILPVLLLKKSRNFRGFMPMIAP
jgi:hypothetical protein